MTVKGLQLSQAFYDDLGKPLLTAQFPSHIDRFAIGLAGRGSQCFGYDDTISQDHGWGPQFLVFMSQQDFADVGSAVTNALTVLPQEYLGFANQHRPSMAVSIPVWFRSGLDDHDIPANVTDWLLLDENRLLEVTNGGIWYDPLGEVTRVRQHLAYYPDPLWRGRLAQKLWQLTDSGVYNFVRSVRRGHAVTVTLALSRFIQATLECCFLLNRRYAPYFKWLYRGFEALPHLSRALQSDILVLTASTPLEEKQTAVFRICDVVRGEVHRQFPETRDIARKDDYFDLWNLSLRLKESIPNDTIRAATILRPA